MSSKLDFTISIPANVASQASCPAPVNQVRFISPQLVADSMCPRQQTSQSVTDYLSQAWTAIVSFLKSIGEYLCCKKKIEAPSSEEIERRRVAQERELAIWQRQMGVNVKCGVGNTNFVDLSARIVEPGYCPALHMERMPQIGHYKENYPILNRLMAVKLPARQLQRFPEALRNELSSYDADHLDVYFMIWQDMPRILEDSHQPGKRNLIYHPIAFPNAQLGETHYHNLSMGIFDAEGIQRDPGSQHQAMPFDRFGEQNVHIHPEGFGMCVSPDDARFHLPHDRAWSSFNSACKFPNGRAAAVFGVILSSNDCTPESNVLLNPLYRNPISLQEYKNGIQNSPLNLNLKNKIVSVLDFCTES